MSGWNAQRWNLYVWCWSIYQQGKVKPFLKIYISPSNISSTARCSSRKRSWASSATRSSARAKRSFSCGHDGNAKVGKGYEESMENCIRLLQHLGHGSNMTLLKRVKLICKWIGPEFLLNLSFSIANELHVQDKSIRNNNLQQLLHKKWCKSCASNRLFRSASKSDSSFCRSSSQRSWQDKTFDLWDLHRWNLEKQLPYYFHDWEWRPDMFYDL